MEKNQTNKHTAFNSLAVSVLILIGLVVYADSLPNSFVWDDENLVLGNPAIRSLPALPELFTGGIFIGIKGNFYRPLQSLTYAADYAVWGLNPLGYHLTNILIHIINAILVYFILFFFYQPRSGFFYHLTDLSDSPRPDRGGIIYLRPGGSTIGIFCISLFIIFSHRKKTFAFESSGLV